VVVIGGGNVAYDVARTAVRREGVESVTLVCIEEYEQMLADPVEIREGEEEGIERINGYGPLWIHADERGSVNAVMFKRCIAVFDTEGAFNPRYDETDIMTLPANTVLFSIGQAYDLSFLQGCGLEVETDPRGMIRVEPDRLSTSLPGLFVAGDLAHGPKLVIDAVASGKRAAVAIHEYVTGETLTLEHREVHTARYADEVADNEVVHPRSFERIPRRPVPTVPVSVRMKHVFGLVEAGFSERTAEEQGGRCLNCAVNTIFNGARCILCGGCTDVCPEYCLRLVGLENIRGDPALERLYRNRYGKDPEGAGSAIIKDEDRCIRCALCAKRCPVDAITMERFVFEEVWKRGP